MTCPSPKVVPVGSHHAPVVAALSERCLEEPWSDGAVASILSTPGAFGFIALVSDTPEAFILCRAAGGECEVLALGTVPERRRKGVALDLVARALEEAALRGAERMILEVAEDNPPARRLYARCGFAVVGRRTGYYRRPSGAHADALVLCRDQDLSSTVQ